MENKPIKVGDTFGFQTYFRGKIKLTHIDNDTASDTDGKILIRIVCNMWTPTFGNYPDPYAADDDEVCDV